MFIADSALDTNVGIFKGPLCAVPIKAGRSGPGLDATRDRSISRGYTPGERYTAILDSCDAAEYYNLN